MQVETNRFKNGLINNTAVPHASFSATFNKYFDWHLVFGFKFTRFGFKLQANVIENQDADTRILF